MRTMLATLMVIALLAGPALAKENYSVPEQNREDCDFSCIWWTWDGSFDLEMCDTAGAAIWQYGASSLDPPTDCDGNPVTDVLGTVLNDDYPSDAGERAILGGTTVNAGGFLLEICHYYDTENSYDGGNVEISVDGGNNWIVVEPTGGYPDDELSDSVNYYAWCVDAQPGFTDGPIGYVNDCFDLSEYMDRDVLIAVKFGSDSSVTYPGWYIASVELGGDITPTEEGSWSTIKGLY